MTDGSVVVTWFMLFSLIGLGDLSMVDRYFGNAVMVVMVKAVMEWRQFR